MKGETAEQKAKRLKREMLADICAIGGALGRPGRDDFKRAWQSAFNALLRAEREAWDASVSAAFDKYESNIEGGGEWERGERFALRELRAAILGKRTRGAK